MTTAQVVGAAATELHRNSAVVLVFVNQATTSKERPDPSMAASSILVSLAKAAWELDDHQVRSDLNRPLDGERPPQGLRVQRGALLRDHPVRHRRVEPVERRRDDV